MALVSSLLDALNQRAQSQASDIAFRFLRDGEVETECLSFGALQQRAQLLATRLLALEATGERALLVYPQGVEFVCAFFACLYAGVTAVPVMAPNRRRGMETLRRIGADSRAKYLLAPSEVLNSLEAELERTTETIPFVRIDSSALAEPLTHVEFPRPEPSALALLQYTSGSTGPPRGVAVTHQNLAANQAQVAESLGSDASTVLVSWLPMFHDMGLGIALQAVWLGIPCILMSPRAFLQRPQCWLRAISNYRATTSGGPDFAYELCARQVNPEELIGLDLSSWAVAFNGSEPVRLQTLDAFARTFAAQGFRPQSFHAVYGLAEATVLASSELPHQGVLVHSFASESLEQGVAVPARSGRLTRLVSYGRPFGDTRAVIAHPETRRECAPGEVGEVWLAGRSIAPGYFGAEGSTRDNFGLTLADRAETEGPFYLRTGDLGFVSDGRLFVTGRASDVLRIAGRSVYPQDVEDVISTSHLALVPHAAATFSVEIEGRAELVILVEVKRSALRTLDGEEVLQKLRSLLLTRLALSPLAVVLLKTGTLLRTTSGKVRRGDCRKAYLNGELLAVAEWRRAPSPVPVSEPARTERESERVQAARISEWLRRHASELALNGAELGSERAREVFGSLARSGLLGLHVPRRHSGLGLGYATAARLLAELALVDFRVALTLALYQYLSIEPIARYGHPLLKDLILPGLAQGSEYSAFAFTDSEASGPESGVGERVGGSERERLFGVKFIEGALFAPSLAITFVCERGRAGMTAFAVFEASEGVRFFAGRPSDAERPRLELTGADVTTENQLGAKGEGLTIARAASLRAYWAIAACASGAIKHCARLALSSVSALHAHIGARTPNPVTLTRLAKIKARAVALEVLVGRVAQALDRSEQLAPDIFLSCRVLGAEFLADTLVDLTRVGLRDVAFAELMGTTYGVLGKLDELEGPPEVLLERAGAALLADQTALAAALGETLGAKDAVAHLERVVEALRHRAARGEDPARLPLQRRCHTRAGELSVWIVLFAALNGEQARSNDQREALEWVSGEIEARLRSLGTQSTTDILLGEQDVRSSFRAYFDGSTSQPIASWTPPARDGLGSAAPSVDLRTPGES